MHMSPVVSIPVYLQVKLPCCVAVLCPNALEWTELDVSKMLWYTGLLKYQCEYADYDPQLVYAAHILNNIHEHGPINNKMPLLRQVKKDPSMQSFEQFYFQLYSCNSKLVPEQCAGKHNPLYQLMYSLQFCHAGTWSSCKCNVPELSKS